MKSAPIPPKAKAGGYKRNRHTFPCPVPTLHDNTYDAINPSRPELSLKGKKAIITGAGSGIGRETVLAFAQARASIAMLGGRRKHLLQETQKMVEAEFPGIQVEAYPIDICDQEAVSRAAKHVGAWDVLVLNSAYLANPGDLAHVDINDWWQAFETNIKGNVVAIQALLPFARRPGACVLACSSRCINFGPVFTIGHSSYAVSKLALSRLMEALAAENPDLHVVSFHPSTVSTDMFDKYFGEMAPALKKQRAVDNIQLPAHFTVWLASPEARFLCGKFVWASWDVRELAEQKDKIVNSEFLTQNTLGWPFELPKSSKYVARL